MVGVIAGAVILNDRREVLLVRHAYGALNWKIPGGAGEPNESPVQTAPSEVLEEPNRATPIRLPFRRPNAEELEQVRPFGFNSFYNAAWSLRRRMTSHCSYASAASLVA